MADLERAMDGIEFRRSKALLDEIPSAYKAIDEVMAHARSLVDVRHVLRQFLNVKGD
jgi:tRNA-splicing ligase RtcB